MTIGQRSLDDAYEYCRSITKKHYENFPVGSLLIPKSKRKYIYSIYAFARFADDIADSPEFTSDDKLERLNILEQELDKAGESEFNPQTKNIFIALSNTIKVLNIPTEEFKNLLLAFKQDAVRSRYKNFDELISYSMYSANPIGHLVLYVFGYDKPRHENVFAYSDKICTALQLINFWQDVSIDLKIPRVYIPEDVMRNYQYTYEMLIEKIENESFRNIIRELVNKTRSILNEGKEILKYVHGRLQYELRAIYSGGNEILNNIERIDYNVLSRRVTLDNGGKVRILYKTFFER